MDDNFDFLSGLVSANLIENGAFCHFLSPEDGTPLYLPGARNEDTGELNPDMRVGAFVRSTSSQVYEKHLDDVTRKALAGNRKAKNNEALKQELVVQQLKKDKPESFAVLVSRFVNTSTKRPIGEWTPTNDEKLALASNPHNRWMVDQVVNFAEDISNFPTAKAGNAVAA
jgi:hypothetical protein